VTDHLDHVAANQTVAAWSELPLDTQIIEGIEDGMIYFERGEVTNAMLALSQCRTMLAVLIREISEGTYVGRGVE
jgi:hypothetical protein